MRAAAILTLGLALFACDRGDEESGGDDPAGEVLEVTGEVTAVRSSGGDERELAAGDPIYADDTVTTGTGATVRIRLEHNGAVWQMREEMERSVRDSMAWKAKASDDDDLLARKDEDESVSAGRHAEDQAADTRDTAMREEAGAADEAPEPGPAPEAKTPAAESEPLRDSPAGGGRRSTGASGAGETDADRTRGGSRRRALEKKDGTAESKKRDSKRELALAPREGGDPRAARRVARIVKGCAEGAKASPAGEITVTLTVGEDGRAESLELEPSTEKLAGVVRCARGKLRRTPFGEAAGKIELTVKLRR